MKIIILQHAKQTGIAERLLIQKLQELTEAEQGQEDPVNLSANLR